MACLRHSVLAATALLCWACGDATPAPDAGLAPDAGPDSGSSDANLGPTPIDDTALPDLAPCPPGWRALPDPEGVVATICDPWPEGGPIECADGEAMFPGSEACTRIGTACPGGDGFPTGLPAGADVLYVREGGSGAGTVDDPFGTVVEAVAVAPPGAIVAIAPGTYDGRVVVDTALTLWGACSDVSIEHASTGPAITVRTEGVAIRNLGVRNAEDGVWVRVGSADVEDLVFEDLRGTGMQVFVEGTVSARRIVVRRAARDAVAVGSGGALDLELGAFEHLGTGGLFFRGGEVSVRDAVLRQVGRPDGDPDFVWAFEDGTVDLTRVVFEESYSTSILVIGTVQMTLTDVVLTGPAEEVDVVRGGIVAFSGATVDFQRVRVERSRVVGIGAAEPGSRLIGQNVLVRRVQPNSSDNSGHGLEVILGGGIELSRLLLDDTHTLAALVDGLGSTATLQDLTIRGVRSDGSGSYGRGIQVQSGGLATVDRVTVDAAREVGIVAAVAPARLTMTDATVRGTLPRACTECPPAGIGVASYQGAQVDIDGLRILDNYLIGVQLAEGGEMDLHDGLVSGHPVGANVQTEGFDTSRLSDQVFYVDNEVNLDSESLPVPAPIIPRSSP